MSGGVDSSSCALLLKDSYPITGFFMELAQPDIAEDKQRVAAVAAHMNIDLHIIALQEQFQKKVLDYFTSSYFAGLTPNPCVVCNHEVKFGVFLDAILDAGMDSMATGHYARVIERDGLYHLCKGNDTSKDQSYFLSRLTQQQLSRVIFPLGTQLKEETYHHVEHHGFMDFRGLESQDVCFLEKNSVVAYLEEHASCPRTSGEIVDLQGTVLGEHQGLHRYTIGQRRGLGISAATPLYVIHIDTDNNRLVVGQEQDLFKREISLMDLHWISGTAPDSDRSLTVKIRYTHKGARASITSLTDKGCSLRFDNPQRAITPGQFGVIYADDEVLGSGVIAA